MQAMSKDTGASTTANDSGELSFSIEGRAAVRSSRGRRLEHILDGDASPVRDFDGEYEQYLERQ